jgi:hypothetical protein
VKFRIKHKDEAVAWLIIIGLVAFGIVHATMSG